MPEEIEPDVKVGPEEEEVQIISSRGITNKHVKFLEDPVKRESDFPGSEYYLSIKMEDLDSGNVEILNSSSSRLEKVLNKLAVDNDGSIAGLTGYLIRRGQGFDVEWGWAYDQKKVD